MADKGEASDWVGLLAETRLALSTLCLEDLEKLAARAEEMFGGTALHATGSLNRPAQHGLSQEHRLLGKLLSATGSNLAVMRRIRSRAAGEEGLRWVR